MAKLLRGGLVVPRSAVPCLVIRPVTRPAIPRRADMRVRLLEVRLVEARLVEARLVEARLVEAGDRC